ncbi:MAG TPA: septum formation inhibitor Maf [Clostridiales bacterium]|jgi:septum formation protein|nr:septum formation inhibitor Maf [Clostridiales bacterium]
MEKLILASGSPRRFQLLTQASIPFEAFPADVDESYDRSLSPADVVQVLSQRKAKIVASQFPRRVILAADTVVALQNKILEKPHTAENAKRMLLSLSGQSHHVLTGITLAKNEVSYTEYVSTKVTFRTLSIQEIDTYIATGEPLDKAGAYGVQEKACIFVERIEGDYYNVVGLPLCRVYRLLSEKYPWILSQR